jgi:hypothetical protein
MPLPGVRFFSLSCAVSQYPSGRHPWPLQRLVLCRVGDHHQCLKTPIPCHCLIRRTTLSPGIVLTLVMEILIGDGKLRSRCGRGSRGLSCHGCDGRSRSGDFGGSGRRSRRRRAGRRRCVSGCWRCCSQGGNSSLLNGDLSRHQVRSGGRCWATARHDRSECCQHQADHATCYCRSPPTLIQLFKLVLHRHPTCSSAAPSARTARIPQERSGCRPGKRTRRSLRAQQHE